MGDNVRIRATKVTQEVGFAGLCGDVYGTTTPSVTDVRVIGVPDNDHAINVHFSERNESHWFAPNLIEFINYGAGQEITIGKKKLVRRADGGWDEVA